MNEKGWAITITPQRNVVATHPHAHKRAERAEKSGWLTMPQAARYLGLESAGGRAPTSVYVIAHEIGHFVGNRWLVHTEDLDAWVRGYGRGRHS
jgi:hypothetical protein